MAYLLLAGVVGMCVGFTLGVLATALVVVSHEDDLPRPVACAYPHGACLVAQTLGHAF